MMWEIVIIGVILIVILYARGNINGNKFVKDNEMIFKLLKEDDYDFYVAAKYGDQVDPDKLFEKRIQNALLVLVVLVFVFISNLNFINLIACFAAAYLIFKSGYSNLRSYYKKHLHEIDLLLPYYLKSLEILIQHYTVPVALSKSIDSAPEIFKKGLRQMIAEINAGDSSINPLGMNEVKSVSIQKVYMITASVVILAAIVIVALVMINKNNAKERYYVGTVDEVQSEDAPNLDNDTIKEYAPNGQKDSIDNDDVLDAPQDAESDSNYYEGIETNDNENIYSITDGYIVNVQASSSLSEYGMTHSADRICDGTLECAWVEGASG